MGLLFDAAKEWTALHNVKYVIDVAKRKIDANRIIIFGGRFGGRFHSSCRNADKVHYLSQKEKSTKNRHVPTLLVE